MKLFRCCRADTATELQALSSRIRETLSQLAARRELFLLLFSLPSHCVLHKPGLVFQFSLPHSTKIAAPELDGDEVQTQEGEGRDASFGSIIRLFH